jgi:ferredoxin-NADP reductase
VTDDVVPPMLSRVAPVAAPGRVLSIEECGPTVRVFRIGRPAGLKFAPGQYVKLGAPGEKREDFSIASAPHDPHLELAIQLREGGTVTPALFALRVGDAVDISEGAKGKLRLEPSAAHHLMVATVTGIAPLISMVRDAIHRGTGDDFTVVVGASYQHELPFHGELEALAAAEPEVTYLPTVSRPTEEANHSWSESTGRADVVARSIVDQFDPATTHVYAVGNAGMIRNVERDFGAAGFRVSTESYGG